MYPLTGLAIFLAICSVSYCLQGIESGGRHIETKTRSQLERGNKAGGPLGSLGKRSEGILGKAGPEIGGFSHEASQNFNGFYGSSQESQMGSHNALVTTILKLLGLTKTVCHVSYAGEALIEKIGDFAIGMNHEIRKIDHNIVNYVTDNIVLKAVDSIRRGQNDMIKFIVDTHVGFTKFATNTILEVYRTTKTPLRELLSCY